MPRRRTFPLTHRTLGLLLVVIGTVQLCLFCDIMAGWAGDHTVLARPELALALALNMGGALSIVLPCLRRQAQFDQAIARLFWRTALTLIAVVLVIGAASAQRMWLADHQVLLLPVLLLFGAGPLLGQDWIAARQPAPRIIAGLQAALFGMGAFGVYWLTPFDQNWLLPVSGWAAATLLAGDGANAAVLRDSIKTMCGAFAACLWLFLLPPAACGWWAVAAFYAALLWFTLQRLPASADNAART